MSTRIVRYCQAVGPRPIGVRESVRPLLTSVNPYCQVLPGSWSETDRSQGVSTTVTDKCQPVLSGTAVTDKCPGSWSETDRSRGVSTTVTDKCQPVLSGTARQLVRDRSESGSQYDCY